MSVSKSEGKLQREIIDALTKCGHWVIRVQSGIVRVKGGFMHLAKAGTPDILVIAPRHGWLEVKPPGEELNDNQIDWHARASAANVRFAVVSGPAEAVETVSNWKG